MNILPTVPNIQPVSIRKEENIPPILQAEAREEIKLDIQACAEKKIEAQAFFLKLIRLFVFEGR
jgi:hypothetical protein